MSICSISGCGRAAIARGWCKTHHARWRKYGRADEPLRNRPHGAGCISDLGYLRKMINGRQTAEHIIVAERALGRPLPAGVVVHHVDENKLNNANGNLVVCTRPYHALIHKRMRALAKCGHADWMQCDYCRSYDDPKNLRVGKTKAHHSTCRREARRQSA